MFSVDVTRQEECSILLKIIYMIQDNKGLVQRLLFLCFRKFRRGD